MDKPYRQIQQPDNQHGQSTQGNVTAMTTNDTQSDELLRQGTMNAATPRKNTSQWNVKAQPPRKYQKFSMDTPYRQIQQPDTQNGQATQVNITAKATQVNITAMTTNDTQSDQLLGQGTINEATPRKNTSQWNVKAQPPRKYQKLSMDKPYRQFQQPDTQNGQARTKVNVTAMTTNDTQSATPHEQVLKATTPRKNTSQRNVHLHTDNRYTLKSRISQKPQQRQIQQVSHTSSEKWQTQARQFIINWTPRHLDAYLAIPEVALEWNVEPG
jgi:hypothetical protein